MTTFGHRLRQVREGLGLSQAALGARCDPPIDRAHITHYETDRQRPGSLVLGRLAAALGLPVAELLAGVDLTTRSLVRHRAPPGSGTVRRQLRCQTRSVKVKT